MGPDELITNSDTVSESLLQAILDNAAESIVLIDKDHKILLFNTVIKEVLKSYFDEELKVGADYRDFVVAESMPLYLQSFEKAINGVSVSVEHETRDGDVSIWFAYKVNPVYDKHRNLLGVTLTATNIDDKKKLEVEREKIISNLLRSNNDLLEFSQIVSHNIRGPLVTLLGLVSLINHDFSEADRRFIINGIKDSSEDLDQVINDLNRILEIRCSPPENKHEVDLSQILSGVKKDILNNENSKVTIESNFTPANKILAIPSYINDIFHNLISNSIKYAKPGIPPIVQVWTHRINGAVIINFKDNGIGIDVQRHKNKIFSLYQKFDLSAEGKGLGLFLIKTQVEKLKGTIEVDSHLGNGTTFKLTLPQ